MPIEAIVVLWCWARAQLRATRQFSFMLCSGRPSVTERRSSGAFQPDQTTSVGIERLL